ncbi:hypothetical protein CLV58_109150 [Spirosoma oryzae]|uniref:DOD-type homing endonuclease domain-containing protein n=1 Tax=Spirosoma oryzae TaxID=1469603 RepID=A0A2T0SYI6_9BACT|nr:hypothetical protein CLV58_109150 [Spirosoma oryzae]
MFINMDPAKLPPKNHPEFLQLAAHERDKCKNGVNINGQYVVPSLYYDLNFHTILYDALDEQGNEIRVKGRPQLRDNGWILHNDYYQAKKEKKGYVVGGARQIGKDLLNTSLLYTPTGEIQIGDAQVGQQIYGADGKLTTITGVYPQGVQPVYQMTLRDGRKLYCGLNHNWYVWNNRKFSGRGVYEVKTTRELLVDYKKEIDQRPNRYETQHSKYAIPTAKPVEYSEKNLPVDPYILGIWLSCGDDRHTALITSDRQLEKVWCDFAKQSGLTCNRWKKKWVGHPEEVIIKGPKNCLHCNPLRKQLTELGLLCNKHIPELYKKASVSQRLALVQGILDGKGSFNASNNVEFSTDITQLMADMEWVCRSLGMSVKQRSNFAELKNSTSTPTVITIHSIFPLFRLDYKLSELADKSEQLNPYKSSIVDIQYVYNALTTCITVDNQDHLFLTDGFTVTHNSDFIVSLTCRELFCFDNAEVLGLFSISQDKDTFNKKFGVAISDKDNFLIVPSIDKDLSQTLIRFGVTRKNNEPIILSQLFTYLTKAGKATEVGAGKSTTFFFFDEIAKEEMQGAWDAVKPALRSSFGGYRNPPLFAFTGGNVEKSKDAIDLFMNPDVNELLSFDTEGKQTGKFMGGWYRADFKNTIPLAQYLNKPVTGELAKLQIQVTDFERANTILDQEQTVAKESKKPGTLAKHKMYNPRTLDEMSLSVTESPFQRYREGLKRHQDWLYETKPGKAVELYTLPGGEVKYTLSEKLPIANFPHKDTDLIEDAPIMLYDEPVHKGSYKLHVGGLDPYNIGQTGTSSSLGALYLMRRHYGGLDDAFQDTMVASYVARPERIPMFLKKIKELLDYFEASMLHESSTDAVLDYFDKDYGAETYLAKTWNLKQEIQPNTSYKGTYGVPPTPAFQKAWMNKIIDYISEVIGETDTGKPILGYTRILDPLLIEEMLQWKEDLNVDRVVSFGHMLLYRDSLEKNDKPVVINRTESDQPAQPKTRSVWGISQKTSRRTTSVKQTRKPFGIK